MKTAPGFDQVVGTSHAVNTKVELRAPDDTVVGVLPVEAGYISADATARVDRWAGDLTLAGLEWAPRDATDPLSGLTGHYCSVQRSGTPYGQPEAWVEVARLWVYSTTVSLSRRDATCQVRLTGPGGLLEATLGSWTPTGGESCQQLIARCLSEYLPYTPTVLDTTAAAVPVPTDLDASGISPLTLADNLAAVADARVYFDAQGRIVIRPVLPSLDTALLTPARQVSIHVDVTAYQITLGRERFANDVITRYRWEDSNGDAQDLSGRAAISTGPLARDGAAGRLTTEVFRDAKATQAQANEYAAAVLDSTKQAWATARITAVQDPRLEPDDIVEAEYLDRTLRHRVIGVSFDLRTDAMELTARTALPTGSP